MAAMKVLYVSHSSQLDGAERCYLETARSLKALNVDVFGLLPGKGPLRGRLERNGIRYRMLCYPWWISRNRPSIPGLLHRGYDWMKAALLTYFHIRKLKADVVISNSIAVPPFAALAARMAGKPHVWYIHEFGWEDHGTHFLWGERLSCRLIDRLSKIVLVNSEAVRAKFQKLIAPQKIRVVHFAVENDEPLPAGPDETVLSKKALNLILLGRFDPLKGQEEAIAAVKLAVARGYDVRLRLVGGGHPDYVSRLRELAGEGERDSRVTLVDFTESPLRYLAAADVALMCSRQEAFGRVTVEAMKMGKPVIGADAGATPELIRPHFNGWLYAAGNVEQLADRIGYCCEHRDELVQMGVNARRWALAEFNYLVHGRSIATILASL